MNRIQRFLQGPNDEPRLGDFVIVITDVGRFRVTHDVALCIRQVMDRWFVPPWIEFPDLVGSFIRLRTRQVRALVECTVEQRAGDRKLDRAREAEEKDDRRPWDNDC